MSNKKLINRMKKMGISFVSIDYSVKMDNEWKELKRTGSDNLPINFIYPPNYPEEPAIKLEPLVSPAHVNLVLDRMEKIVSSLN